MYKIFTKYLNKKATRNHSASLCGKTALLLINKMWSSIKLNGSTEMQMVMFSWAQQSTTFFPTQNSCWLKTYSELQTMTQWLLHYHSKGIMEVNLPQRTQQDEISVHNNMLKRESYVFALPMSLHPVSADSFCLVWNKRSNTSQINFFYHFQISIHFNVWSMRFPWLSVSQEPLVELLRLIWTEGSLIKL